MVYQCTPPGSPKHEPMVYDEPSRYESGQEPNTAVNRDTGVKSSSGYFTPVYSMARQPRPLNRDGTPVTSKPDDRSAARQNSEYPKQEPEFLKSHQLLQRVHSVFYRQDERARIARGEEKEAESRSHRSW